MKQIFNWTIGSFFRSFGRILCYIVVGGIIALLLYSNDSVRDFRITDLLGIERIFADELHDNAWVTFYTDEQKQNALPAQGYYQYYTLNNNTNQNMVSIFLSQNFTRDNNFDYISIPYMLLGNTTTTGTYATKRFECSWREVYDSPNYYYIPTSCGFDSSSSGNTDTQVIPVESDLRISIVLTDGLYNAPCKMDKDSITCQLQRNINYHILVITYASNGLNSNTGLKIGFNYVVGRYKNSQNAMIEQQQQTNQAIQSMNQTISDTNATSDVSSASQFFGDFNETAQDGIKAIVSMPLNIFNALTLGSTKDLCFNLKGKQSCFPSGAMLWNKSSRTTIHVGNATWTPHPFSNGGGLSEQLTLFKSLFNIVVGGYLAYKMLKSLMRITNDMLSPTKDKVEVLDL